MGHTEGQVYGYIHLPCRVEVNARLHDSRVIRGMNIEFTGERVVPGRVDEDLWNEHLARYTFSERFCRGRRVLDAGCGTGYGANQLALAAQSVVGVDIAQDAIAYAASEYSRSNLRFVQAPCTALPFAAASFDVVVSFESNRAPAAMGRAHQRSAKSTDGRRSIVVSTPNKNFYAQTRADSGPNPFHEHEFELEEFRDALSRVFPHVTIAFENHAGCVLFESSASDSVEAHLNGRTHIDDANFYIAVCSAQQQSVSSFVYVPENANQLKERGTRIQSLETELQLKNGWLKEAQIKHSELVRLHTETDARTSEEQRLGSRT